jgi:hypothetical protein
MPDICAESGSNSGFYCALLSGRRPGGMGNPVGFCPRVRLGLTKFCAGITVKSNICRWADMLIRKRQKQENCVESFELERNRRAEDENSRWNPYVRRGLPGT